MKRIASLLGTAALVLTIVPSTFAASPVVPPSKAGDTIVGIAVGNGNFATLVKAVTCADPTVLAALTSGEQYTVFAPTDAAFAAAGLNVGNVCALPQGTLTDILLYHVTDGRRFSNSVLARGGPAKTIDTLLGQSFWVARDGSITTTSGGHAAIVMPDIAATNGVIHVIDSVLVPRL